MEVTITKRNNGDILVNDKVVAINRNRDEYQCVNVDLWPLAMAFLKIEYVLSDIKCERCECKISKEDIDAYRYEANDETLNPAVCSDCADIYASLSR